MTDILWIRTEFHHYTVLPKLRSSSVTRHDNGIYEHTMKTHNFKSEKSITKHIEGESNPYDHIVAIDYLMPKYPGQRSLIFVSILQSFIKSMRVQNVRGYIAMRHSLKCIIKWLSIFVNLIIIRVTVTHFVHEKLLKQFHVLLLLFILYIYGYLKRQLRNCVAPIHPSLLSARYEDTYLIKILSYLQSLCQIMTRT